MRWTRAFRARLPGRRRAASPLERDGVRLSDHNGVWVDVQGRECSGSAYITHPVPEGPGIPDLRVRVISSTLTAGDRSGDGRSPEEGIT